MMLDICPYCFNENISKETISICSICGETINHLEWRVEEINLLEQYQYTSLGMTRTFNSIGTGLIDREESIKGKIKKINSKEIKSEAFEYFYNNIELQKDFKDRFCKEVGKEKYIKFCSIIIDQWSDGKSKRIKEKELKALKLSIHNYLESLDKTIYCKSEILTNIYTTFNINEIKIILKINEEMIDYAIQDWIKKHERGDEFSSNEVYFRRGINVKFNKKDIYYENDYINSYTLSTTIAEQFSQTGNSKRTIVHGEYGIFYNRILFFAPFIKGLEGQLEVGIIPHYEEITYNWQKNIAETDEYILKM